MHRSRRNRKETTYYDLPNKWLAWADRAVWEQRGEEDAREFEQLAAFAYGLVYRRPESGDALIRQRVLKDAMQTFGPVSLKDSGFAESDAAALFGFALERAATFYCDGWNNYLHGIPRHLSMPEQPQSTTFSHQGVSLVETLHPDGTRAICLSDDFTGDTSSRTIEVAE